jgi:hypothetical protein
VAGRGVYTGVTVTIRSPRIGLSPTRAKGGVTSPTAKTAKAAKATAPRTPRSVPAAKVARVVAVAAAVPRRKLLRRRKPYVVMASMGQLLGPAVPPTALADRRRYDRADRRGDFRKLFGALAVLMVAVLGLSIVFGNLLQAVLHFAFD